VDGWDFEDPWTWDEQEGDYQIFLYAVAEELSDLFFLSDNYYTPDAMEDYNLGYLAAELWWPLVTQLSGMVDLEAVVDLAHALDGLLRLPGLPTELLEAPLIFLESVLEGNLPREPSGRRVDSRRLVKIALTTTQYLQHLSPPAQSAARAWASVHRQILGASELDAFDFGEEDFADLLFAPDLPPAVTGFSMVIGMTLMRWPERGEGLPLPPKFLDPELYDEMLDQWLALPDSPTVTEEGVGEAEALFAQGQLAHVLADLGAMEGVFPDEAGDGDMKLTYSRLSRAILWVHSQCRHCPERDGIACKAADNWTDRPVALLDVAGEIANTSRISGCIKM
jgi:hypothetical protein